MFWLLVGSLMVGLMSSVKSSYGASRDPHEGWLWSSEPQIEVICCEASKESLEVYQDLALDTAGEECQEAASVELCHPRLALGDARNARSGSYKVAWHSHTPLTGTQ